MFSISKLCIPCDTLLSREVHYSEAGLLMNESTCFGKGVNSIQLYLCLRSVKSCRGLRSTVINFVLLLCAQVIVIGGCYYSSLTCKFALGIIELSDGSVISIHILTDKLYEFCESVFIGIWT